MILNIVAAEASKKPGQKLAEEEERVCLPVETKPSDKMGGFANMVTEHPDELGADVLFAAQATYFRDTWNALYSCNFGHFEDTSELFTL